jgi:hypothetical protein
MILFLIVWATCFICGFLAGAAIVYRMLQRKHEKPGEHHASIWEKWRMHGTLEEIRMLPTYRKAGRTGV